MKFSYLMAAITLISVVLPKVGSADYIIDVGNHTLLPNTPGQLVPINIQSVATDPALTGFTLNARIGDGVGGSSEPVFNGTLGSFEGIIFDDGAGGQDYQFESLTGLSFTGTGAPNSSNASFANVSFDFTNERLDGLLFDLVIDTTGFTTGTYALNLIDADPLSDTELSNAGGVVPLTVTNGSITVAVPEPSGLGLIGLVGVFAAMRRRRST